MKKFFIFIIILLSYQSFAQVFVADKEATQEMVDNTVSLSSELKSNMTDEEIQERINNGTVSFIIHGLTDYIPEEYVKFKEKYGIGLRVENCSVGVFDNVIENNQRIYDYLNQKYGEEWQNELESKPFGIKY